jgi:predicted secreted hydrolase
MAQMLALGAGGASTSARSGAPIRAEAGAGGAANGATSPKAAAPVTSPTTLQRRPLVFPLDHGAHPDQGIEWWYLTGWLAPRSAPPGTATTAGNARSGTVPALGFQLTFFRSRGPARPDHPSRFAARQVLMAHAAVTVLPGAASFGPLAAGHLSHDQRIARAGPGSASAAEHDTAVQLGAGARAWWLRRRSGPGGHSEYHAQFGLDQVAAGDGDSSGAGRRNGTGNIDEPQPSTLPLRLALTLTANAAPLLQGEAGWSRKGPSADQSSFYVSEPQLQLSGLLSLAEQTHALAGRAWLDHEWSGAILPAQAEGWDWLGINLFDGSALTLFRLRQRPGSGRSVTQPAAPSASQDDRRPAEPSPPTGVYWAGGSWRGTNGTTRSYTPGEVGMAALRHWRSAATGAHYPVAWRLETPEGHFELHALLDSQELDARASTATVYWEGLAELRSDDGRQVLGLGYLELTGYAGRPAL